MNETFEARNELEEKLVAAQDGRISSEEFIEALLESRVFMPVKDAIGIEGFEGSDHAVPLTLQAEDDTEVLIIFTSPERARSFLTDFPGYEGGLLAEFSWVLDRVGPGFGISINPGWPAGMDMEPDMVETVNRIKYGKAPDS